MYDKCYFCLDQLPKLKKESTASFFVNFGRSRGTKEPTYITVGGCGGVVDVLWQCASGLENCCCYGIAEDWEDKEMFSRSGGHMYTGLSSNSAHRENLTILYSLCSNSAQRENLKILFHCTVVLHS